ncbi:T9SS type A sorting domain-containing protein [Candidatus Latescibacterota bacterium]
MKIACSFLLSLFYTTLCFGDMSGYVRDYRGNPVQGATINFTGESNPMNIFSATTESDGSYKISGLTTVVNQNENKELLPFELYQNYPNPFNPQTTISFNLINTGFVELTIYNMLGQKVRTLIKDSSVSTGTHRVVWDGLDDSGIPVGSGIYIYQIRVNNRIASRKMLLLDSGYSMTGSSSPVKIYSSSVNKPIFEKLLSEETTYHITITGEDIKPFEKSGIELQYLAPSADFMVARAGSDFHLSIVHNNDAHSRILPETVDGNTQINCARIATMSKWLRNQRQNVLMLNAGDQFERSNFNTIVHEAHNQIVNLLNYDCMTIGNWDISYGPILFADFINGLNSSVVSSNINVENEPILLGLFEPYTIKEIGGHRVGIVGVATTNREYYSVVSPVNIENIILNNIMLSVQTAVDELKTQDVNIIIVISHAGYSEDIRIAGELNGVDIIVGGHDHVLFSNTDDRASGPYPFETISPSGEPVLIVQSGSYYEYLGCLDVIFNEHGIAYYWAGDSYSMDNDIPEDEAVAAIVDDVIEKLEKK